MHSNLEVSLFVCLISWSIQCSNGFLFHLGGGGTSSSRRSHCINQRVHTRVRGDEPYRHLEFRKIPSTYLSCAKAKAADDERLELTREFCLHLSNSIQEGTFRSFTLYGPSASKHKKNNNQSNNKDQEKVDQLRGCFKRIQGRRVQLQEKKTRKQQKDKNADAATTVIQVTFKYHLATDVVKNWIPSELSSRVQSLLILDPSDENQQEHNMRRAMVSEWGERWYPVGDALGIQRATLETLQHQWELEVGFQTKRPTLKRKTVSPNNSDKKDDASTLAHDRTKDVPIETSADFLYALGVTNDKGKPRPGKSSKLRQIQKFVEIVSGLVSKVMEDTKGDDDDSKRPISVIDMGCGRGYLTFALHSHLNEKYNNSTTVMGRGIDVRPKLVQEINGISRSLGPTFDGLVFETGTIESFLLEETSGIVHQSPTLVDSDTPSAPLEILIALHACDTATDDALWAGIRRQAQVICVAPCCHKEIRPQLDQHVSSQKTSPLADVLRYGIYRERTTETVTDAMRALLLELMGYDVNIFEFIGGEHTSKNVMITAVKNKTGQRGGSKMGNNDIRDRLQSLAQFYSISNQKLAAWMGEELDSSSSFQQEANMKISSKGLPLD